MSSDYKMITLTDDQTVHLQRAVERLDGVLILQYQPSEEYHTCVAIECWPHGVEYLLLHLLRALPDDVVDAFETAIVKRDDNVVYFPNIETNYVPEED